MRVWSLDGSGGVGCVTIVGHVPLFIGAQLTEKEQKREGVSDIEQGKRGSETREGKLREKMIMM